MHSAVGILVFIILQNIGTYIYAYANYKMSDDRSTV